MSDSYGDGWTGNNWTGFGKTFTIKDAKKQKSVNFVVGGGSSKASVTDVMDAEAAAIDASVAQASPAATTVAPAPTGSAPATTVPVVEVPTATTVAPTSTGGYQPVGPVTTTSTV